MNISRRNFLGSAAALGGFAFAAGCCSKVCPSACCAKAKVPAKVGLQLYSIRGYIKKVGLAKALEDVKKLGYAGVQFAGYYNFSAAEIKKMLDDNGLERCGTHVSRDRFSLENIQKSIVF